MTKMNILGNEVKIYDKNDTDFISITDMARYKDSERTDYIVQNWMRSRTTIEFLGLWEQLNNPDFNPIEFDGFKKKARWGSYF